MGWCERRLLTCGAAGWCGVALLGPHLARRPSVGTVEQALPQTTVPHTAGRPYLRPRIGIDAEISILYVAPASRKVKSTRTAMFRMRIGDHNLGVGPLAQP